MRQRFGRCGIVDFFQRLSGVNRFAPVAAKTAVDPVARDAAEPGFEFVPLAQVAEMFPRGDESFLREVFALAEAAGGAVGQRADERLIARYDVAEGVAVAGKTRGDQIGVVVRGADMAVVIITGMSGRITPGGDKF